MENKELTINFGEQPVGTAIKGPNARIVMVQPSAKMPDGSVRDLQPYELKVTVDPLTAIILGSSLVLSALILGVLNMCASSRSAS